ncbi:hypothetical protein E2C01_031403 [Portunus trituberculatus]|uniref:Uncharacterized protein n=1 Tax=Portunus trituberculatus TaxID=210409 RepID=A0A5B7EY11_PORTR|nr:hypothetical protein [Portunus trituberculatus]
MLFSNLKRLSTERGRGICDFPSFVFVTLLVTELFSEFISVIELFSEFISVTKLFSEFISVTELFSEFLHAAMEVTNTVVPGDTIASKYNSVPSGMCFNSDTFPEHQILTHPTGPISVFRNAVLTNTGHSLRYVNMNESLPHTAENSFSNCTSDSTSPISSGALVASADVLPSEITAARTSSLLWPFSLTFSDVTDCRKCKEAASFIQ